jgi:hypothetical protein
MTRVLVAKISVDVIGDCSRSRSQWVGGVRSIGGAIEHRVIEKYFDHLSGGGRAPEAASKIELKICRQRFDRFSTAHRIPPERRDRLPLCRLRPV